jgi:hypothetical protein
MGIDIHQIAGLGHAFAVIQFTRLEPKMARDNPLISVSL